MHTTHPSHSTYFGYTVPEKGWIHHEIKVPVPLGTNYFFKFINRGVGKDRCYFDNIAISSIHGPSEINKDPLTFLMKGV